MPPSKNAPSAYSTSATHLKVNLEDVMNELTRPDRQTGRGGKQSRTDASCDIAAEQKALAERRQQFDAAREQLAQEKIALAERIRDDSARESEIKRLIDDANAREAAMYAADEKLRGSRGRARRTRRQVR